MEFIFELLVQVVWFLLRIMGEVIIQIIGEAIGELMVHSVREPFRRPEPIHPWLAAIGYAIFGAIAGGISVWLVPNHLTQEGFLRIANLFVTPVLAGFVMAAVGRWRRRHEKPTLRLESFSYGYCFALAMGLVRYFVAN